MALISTHKIATFTARKTLGTTGLSRERVQKSGTGFEELLKSESPEASQLQLPARWGQANVRSVEFPVDAGVLEETFEQVLGRRFVHPEIDDGVEIHAGGLQLIGVELELETALLLKCFQKVV